MHTIIMQPFKFLSVPDKSTVNGIVEEVVVAGERDCEDQAGEQGSPGKQCHQWRFFFWT